MKPKKTTWIALLACLALLLLSCGRAADGNRGESQPTESTPETQKTEPQTQPTDPEPEEELLSDEELRTVAQELTERRLYIIRDLFFHCPEHTEMAEDAGLNYMEKCEIIDSEYQSIDDVRAVVESVFTASKAAEHYRLVEDAEGGPEYQNYHDDGDNPRVYAMYKESDGKLYYYVTASDMLSTQTYDYDSIEVLSRTADEVAFTIDEIITGPDDVSDIDPIRITITKANGVWLIDSFERADPTGFSSVCHYPRNTGVPA